MIGKLRGVVDSVSEESLLIDVAGVGYLVFCSAKTLQQLPPSGGTIALVIETHVREDHIHLYGFLNESERQWFRILTTVQGVGVKMALAILGMFAPDELITIIAAQDKSSLTRVSGVGPKLAERITTELKNTVAKLPTGAVGGVISGAVNTAAQKGSTGGKKSAVASITDDAVSALSHLGYSRMDAFSAVSRALQQSPDASLDKLITTALRELAA
jgi:holliday junction DNA helicase RuvA